MSIASDAPAAHTPSAMRSVSLRRKIRGRCVRLSVSLGAASYGKRRKVSITIRLHRHATSRAGEREARSDKTFFDVQAANQTPSDFVTGKRSDYSADAAQNRADKNELVSRRADARTAQSAHRNAGEERHRPCSFRRSRPHIAH